MNYHRQARYDRQYPQECSDYLWNICLNKQRSMRARLQDIWQGELAEHQLVEELEEVMEIVDSIMWKFAAQEQDRGSAPNEQQAQASSWTERMQQQEVEFSLRELKLELCEDTSQQLQTAPEAAKLSL